MNETKRIVFASRTKAALFITRHLLNLQAWRVEFAQVDRPGVAAAYTLRMHDLVDKLKLKLDLTGESTDYMHYDVLKDPLLGAARNILKNY